MGGSEPFLGMLLLIPYNFTPLGWQLCDGSLLPISQYDALYALLGTTYGGDGVNTFGVPDLRGRTAVGAGQGQGLQNYLQGQVAGAENITVTTQTLASHSHPSLCSDVTQSGSVPNGAVIAAGPAIYSSTTSGASLAPATIQKTGGDQSHNNMQPYQVLKWVISLQGIFPSQG
jgi:microcystin-dependent protein